QLTPAAPPRGVLAPESALAGPEQAGHHHHADPVRAADTVPIEYLLERARQVQRALAVEVGALLEDLLARDPPQSGELVGAQAEGRSQVRIRVVVQRVDAVAPPGEEAGQRGRDGGLAGATLAGERDPHQVPPRPGVGAPAAAVPGRPASPSR